MCVEGGMARCFKYSLELSRYGLRRVERRLGPASTPPAFPLPAPHQARTSPPSKVGATDMPPVSAQLAGIAQLSEQPRHHYAARLWVFVGWRPRLD
jgi:hypothetical protein